jgi:molybdenum cofactor biosynthesis enzyme MoaA
MEKFDLIKISEKLNKVSPAFCLAKYDLFTLHLHLGMAHSCHLTSLKKLNADDIKGPYDFFNFPEIKEIRKKMKEGIKDSDCQYCWDVEKNSAYSDRQIQSWGIDYRYDEIVKMDPLKDDIIPSYLEISFSNLCNMKCTYCNDNFSSRWENDIKKHGDYHNDTGVQRKKTLEEKIKGENIFLKKFKEFFPEILKNLYFLRITGGEPLLHDELYEILDYIIDNPPDNLILSINTNLCTNPKKINTFFEKMKLVEKNVKQIFIYTSCDSSGEHAEFIREGLNYEYWKENCHRVLNELKKSNLNIMCTFNNLCLTNEFKTFINDVYDMTQYSIGEKESRIYINIQPLAFPMHQSIEILDYDIFKDIINEIEDLLNSYYLEYENGVISKKGFLEVNIKKFEHIKYKIKNSKNNHIKNKKNFLYFLDQCKIRNGKDYFNIFNDDNYKKYFFRIINEFQKFKINSKVFYNQISHKFISKDFDDSYLEISFSNLCNMKCTYCNPNFSSRWEDDLQKHGDFIHDSKKVYFESKNNDLINQEFKRHFPYGIKFLKTLRIVGGEPIIQKELYDVLDLIDNNPHLNLNLCINTNLSTSENDFNNFLNKLKKINNKVKKISIYTICDSSGEHAEFIREGLNYEIWKKNCYRILDEINNSYLDITSVFNNLCLTDEFKVFINDVYNMTHYSIGLNEPRVSFNIEILKSPIYQSVEILDYDIFEKIINEIQVLLDSYELKYEKEIIINKGFSNSTIQNFKEISELVKNTSKNNHSNKHNFLYFLNQCKIRNNKNYYDYFKNNLFYKRFFSRIINILKINTQLKIISKI